MEVEYKWFNVDNAYFILHRYEYDISKGLVYMTNIARMKPKQSALFCETPTTQETWRIKIELADEKE